MKLLNKVEQQEEKRVQCRAYEAPAIIYETIITTRAGSPTGSPSEPDGTGVDPADLFGNG